MDIFNHKKLADFKYKVICLEEKINELKYIIQNKGYKIPETKVLAFRNTKEVIFNSHFNKIMSFMNAHDIAIVKYDFSKVDWTYCCSITYRLPSNIKSVDFDYIQSGHGDNISYRSDFKIIYIDDLERK